MFPRNKYLNLLLRQRNDGLVKIITGPRRCGKSFLLNNIFYEKLLEQGVSKAHIIKFAFDNPEDQDLLDKYDSELETKIYIKKDFYIISSKKFRLFIKDRIKDDEEYILLLDEVQLLENFVDVLNGFLYQKNVDVYVTGSNSYLLSSDVDTKFGGRGFKIELFPLTFKEFVEGSGLSKEEAFNLYIRYGGLPLVASMNEREDKFNYLKSTNKETYLKDIITRHGIKNASDLEDVYNLLASSIGSRVSPTKLVNTFKSKKGKDITDDTIASYINHFEDSFLVKKANVFNIKGNKFINSPYKVYFEDIGIRNAILNSFGNDAGHIIENIVYNELKHRGFDVSVGQVSYSETNKFKELIKIDSEIDFIATKELEKYYIQVSLNINDEEVYRREIKSFNKINDSFRKLLLVKDGLPKRIDSTGVVIVDVIDFLLSNEI